MNYRGVEIVLGHRILSALRLKYILPPEAHNGEFCRLVFPTPVHIQRHLGLYTGHRGATTDDLPGKSGHVIPGL